MRGRIEFLIIGMALSVLFVATAVSHCFAFGTTYYAKQDLNIYQSWSANSAIITTVQKGDSIVVTGSEDFLDGWWRVYYKRQYGYVHKSKLTRKKIENNGSGVRPKGASHKHLLSKKTSKPDTVINDPRALIAIIDPLDDPAITQRALHLYPNATGRKLAEAKSEIRLAALDHYLKKFKKALSDEEATERVLRIYPGATGETLEKVKDQVRFTESERRKDTLKKMQARLHAAIKNDYILSDEEATERALRVHPGISGEMLENAKKVEKAYAKIEREEAKRLADERVNAYLKSGSTPLADSNENVSDKPTISPELIRNILYILGVVLSVGALFIYRKQIRGLLFFFKKRIASIKFSWFAIAFLLVLTIIINILFVTNKRYQVKGVNAELNRDQYHSYLNSPNANPTYIIEHTKTSRIWDMPEWITYIFYLIYFLTVMIVAYRIIKLLKTKTRDH